MTTLLKLLFFILAFTLNYSSSKANIFLNKSEPIAGDYQLDCSKIPRMFSSFNEANRIVRQAKWIFKDKIDSFSSSWIRSAEYYSCNNQHGYLIMCTDDKCYIFDNLEKSVWNGFKKASSKGKYYHAYIRNKYQMYDRIN
jgi:hypothetical protein